MTDDEIMEWELAYEEVARRDFERKVYEQCDAEDAEKQLTSGSRHPQAGQGEM
jgi:hypothetical protein